MAGINDTSALNALNEKDYINKLYDSNTDTTKKLLEQNFTDNAGTLNQEQNRVQQQTAENVNRTQVEAQSAQDSYNGPKLTLGASQQEALSRGNATQKNVTDLNQQQAQAQAEIDRQRKLMGDLYASQIKEAQANNDMERAQMLYDAARSEDEKFLALRQQAATLMASKGDNSILDAIASGSQNTAPENAGETWDEVLKNEARINGIYDNELEALKQQLYQTFAEESSDLEAKRQQRQAQTDEQLTQAYVDALQKAKNYQEVQTAYGQGSGTAAAARIARDTELQDALTDIRRLYAENDAGYGIDNYDIGAAYRDAIAKKTAETNSKRLKELYSAAEEEEQKLLENQQFVGEQYAKQGNYETIGKLYGLTADQVDRLMNRGKYAPIVYYGGGDDGSSSGTPRKKTPPASSGSSNTVNFMDRYLDGFPSLGATLLQSAGLK